MMNKLAKEIYENAKQKGFYDDGKASNIGERLALIHSEVSEALEADRKNKHGDVTYFLSREQQILKSYSKPAERLDDEDFKTLFKNTVKDSFEDEMADVIIRCLDMCAYLGIDIEKHVELKMRYNSTREKMHGKNY